MNWIKDESSTKIKTKTNDSKCHPTAASGKYILFSKFDFPWRLFQGVTKLYGGDMEILVSCAYGTVF